MARIEPVPLPGRVLRKHCPKGGADQGADLFAQHAAHVGGADADVGQRVEQQLLARARAPIEDFEATEVDGGLMYATKPTVAVLLAFKNYGTADNYVLCYLHTA